MGPLFGAVLMTLLPEFVRGLAEWRTVFFSIMIIALLLIRPEGLLTFRTITARATSRHTSAGSKAQ